MKTKTCVMIDGILHWECSKCKRFLKENEYYRDKKSINGLKSQCKKCHGITSIETRNKEKKKKANREYMRRAREKKPEKFRRRERLAARKRIKTEKTIARYKFNYAVKSGKIQKPERCSDCGKKTRIVGHHEDYSKPLDVKYLCYECHPKHDVLTIGGTSLRGLRINV